MTKEEAQNLITAKIDQIQTLLSELEEVADKHELSFKISVSNELGLVRDPTRVESYGGEDYSTGGRWAPTDSEGWVSSSWNC